LLGLFASSPAIAEAPREQFTFWDHNHDGKLTRDELPELIRPLFDQVDTNSDGTVSPDEDRAFVERQAKQPTLPPARVPGAQRPLAQPPRLPENIRAELDLPYADTENPRQRLDLYLPRAPKSDKPLPLVAFVHGGAWQAGDKRTGYFSIAPLLETGDYACASIGYRLSGEATWPAQIHDCKAAIRWLRANAAKYNLDPDRIGVMGNSAGGHLVAMLGVTGDVSPMEGSLGKFTSTSSRVRCVVDQFGTTDFSVIRSATDGPVSKLLGVDVTKDEQAARSSSPITYVSKDDPPFLFIHGKNDPVVPFSQSEILDAALTKIGVEATLVPVEGGGHGNFGTLAVPERIRQFFDKHLRDQAVTVSADAITARPAR
jgi:acetyl esterase/lipase